jgi:hypothetical protein
VHALNALAPYLDDVVICGAWAWYVYRKYLGTATELPTDFTRDLDCASGRRVPVRRDQTIVQCLEASGFEWAPRGDDPPPSYYKWPSAERPDVEVEFLTPKRGSGEERIVAVQQDLNAQALWHLDILLFEPLEVELAEESDDPGEPAFRGKVLVPRMGHFVVQKGLIVRRRSEAEQMKDLFYVFDLIDSETGLGPRVHEDVVRASAKGWNRDVAQGIAALERQFDSAHVLAGLLEQYPQERRPSRRYVQEEARRWLEGVSQALAP